MSKKIKYDCPKRMRCSVCQRRLSMKVNCYDKLLRCSNCKVPYIQRVGGVFRAVKAKQIRRLRYLYKSDKVEFRNQLKNINRHLLKPFKYDEKLHVRDRLIELWANKPKDKPKEDKRNSLEEVRRRILECRKKTA